MPSSHLDQIVPPRRPRLLHYPLQPLDFLRSSHDQTFMRFVVCNCEADEINVFVFRAFDSMELAEVSLFQYARDGLVVSVEFEFRRAHFLPYAVLDEPFAADCITKDAPALGLDGDGWRWCWWWRIPWSRLERSHLVVHRRT
jgi:hypothetical protein